MPAVYNWTDAVLLSLTRILADLAAFLPKLAGAAAIVLIGWITAGVVESLVARGLRLVGFNRIARRAGIDRFLIRTGLAVSPATIAGRLVYWTLILAFVTAATSVLELNQFSVLLAALIAYIPKVFIALAILVLGAVAAQAVGNVVRGSAATAHLHDGELLAVGARAALLGFAALMALDQLQIAPTIVSALWTAVLQTLALALGLSFGLGGRDVARRLAERWYARVLGPHPAFDPSEPAAAGAPTRRRSVLRPLAGRRPRRLRRR